jgi:hypothetical protein
MTFNLNIIDCNDSAMVDRVINNMSVLVSKSSTQLLTFDDTLSAAYASPVCGANSYVF